jgi:hypothetical protein
MGNTNMPPHIKRAHAIDNLMNEKAGSCDLDDEDIIDVEPKIIEVSDSDEKGAASGCDSVKLAVKAKHTGPVAHCPAANYPSVDSSHTHTCNHSQNLLNNLSQVLDPSVQCAYADKNSVNMLQTGQIFSLSGQLQESQQQLEGLQNWLIGAEHCCNKAEHRADHADLMEMITGSHGHQVSSQC